MNYAEAAEKLAAKGRHGDTMVVHMHPLEVAWMNSVTPGGLTTNPDTGQPEAFAFLIPLLANLAAPSLMASLGLTGTGALLGSAALGGLADYAVNRDAGRALGSAALGFGLGSLGNAMSAPKVATSTARAANPAQISNAVNPITANVARPVAAGVSDAAQAIGRNVPSPVMPTVSVTQPAVRGGLQAALAAPGDALRTAMADPVNIGIPIAAGVTSMMAPRGVQLPGMREDPRYTGDYARERLPGARELRQMSPEELATYGRRGGEFPFFSPNNDRRASPPSLGAPGLGAYRGYAEGGKVEGYGDGMHDTVPIMASDGEYVIPADVVSMLGRGSTNGGASALDRFVANVRANPPRERAA